MDRPNGTAAPPASDVSPKTHNQSLNSLGRRMNEQRAFPGVKHATANYVIGKASSQGIRRCPHCHAPNSNFREASDVACEVCENIFKWDGAVLFANVSSHRADRNDTLVPTANEPKVKNAQCTTKALHDVLYAGEEPSTGHKSTSQAYGSRSQVFDVQSFSKPRIPQAKLSGGDLIAQSIQERLRKTNSIVSETDFTTTDHTAKITFDRLENGQLESSQSVGPSSSTSRQGVSASRIPNPPPSEAEALRPSDSAPIRWNDPYNHHRPIIMGPKDPNMEITPMLEDAFATISAYQDQRPSSHSATRD